MSLDAGLAPYVDGECIVLGEEVVTDAFLDVLAINPK